MANSWCVRGIKHVGTYHYRKIINFMVATASHHPVVDLFIYNSMLHHGLFLIYCSFAVSAYNLNFFSQRT